VQKRVQVKTMRKTTISVYFEMTVNRSIEDERSKSLLIFKGIIAGAIKLLTFSAED
jgi:hypothetical protein